MTNKVDKEVAEQDFERWADSWGIEIDETQLDEEDKKSLDIQRSRVVSAICKGKLVVSETGDEVTLETNKGPVTFKEPTGASYLATDQHKGKDMAGSFGFMGAMSGNPAKFFSSVKGSDLKIAQAITALFLGS